ncbi:MAG: recombination regulator RecX [Fimbriimonadaceae bacterium]|nr:recombination regulator RecX [Fimbriimonadaceae bacterium]
MKTALQLGVDLLKRRDRSCYEVREALERAGHPPEEIAAALARLSERGYLNDARLAESEAERLRGKGWGPLRVAAEMQKRGLPPVEFQGDEAEDARLALEEAGRISQGPARAARWLLSRGFNQEAVERVVSELFPLDSFG